MLVVVVGAGAVGSLFAARLSEAGHAVILVARADHVTAIQRDGLRVLNGKEEVARVEAATTLSPGARPDAAFLTVKTFDLERVASVLARTVAKPVPTLLPQNGLGVESRANEALGSAGWPDAARWTVRAVNSVPATWVGPGVVRAAGTGEVVLPETGPLTPHAGEFERLLVSARFRVRTVPAIDREVWRKVLVNAAINPVTAVRRIPNGRLLEEPAKSEALALLREALLAAHAEGFDFSEGEVVRDFESIARATAENRSSMLQDLDHGRPTEIETISGALLSVARSHGLDLPATRAIAEEVRRRARLSARPPQPS